MTFTDGMLWQFQIIQLHMLDFHRIFITANEMAHKVLWFHFPWAISSNVCWKKYGKLISLYWIINIFHIIPLVLCHISQCADYCRFRSQSQLERIFRLEYLCFIYIRVILVTAPHFLWNNVSKPEGCFCHDYCFHVCLYNSSFWFDCFLLWSFQIYSPKLVLRV